MKSGIKKASDAEADHRLGAIPLARVWIVLTRAHRVIAQYLEGGIALHGVTMSEFIVLEVLLHKGPLALDAVCRRTGLDSVIGAAAAERMLERKFLCEQRGITAGARSNVLTLSKSGEALIRKIFSNHERDIERIFSVLDLAQQVQLHGALKTVGIHARQQSSARVDDRAGGLAPWQLRRVTDYVSRHIDRAVSLAELASQVGLSGSQFRRSLKASLGLTPRQWQTSQRIEFAKKLLRDGGVPLAQVALASGFMEQSHFSRAFHRVEGISPGAWRRAHRA